jgi:dTDP-L-rhamnose 4-epimerase
MKILVTGGAGFIGSHLADELLTHGHRVAVFDSLEPQVHGATSEPVYLSSNVELMRGDVCDRASLAHALEGVEVVYHFAAVVGVGQSQYQIARYTATNVLGTAMLLDILANDKHSVRKLIIASSMSIYGEGLYRRPSDGQTVTPQLREEAQLRAGDFEIRDPKTGEVLEPVPTPEGKPLFCTSIYALNKRNQEEYGLLFGRTYGVPVVACRFFNVYGPRQSLSNPYTGVAAIFMSRIKNGHRPLIFEDGCQSRDFIDVRDVARACVILMENERAEGQVVNIGTGRATSILALARILIAMSDQHLRPEIVHRYRKGDVRHCFADVSKARALGFQAEIPLDEGLAYLKAWADRSEAVDLVDRASDELERRGLITGDRPKWR